MQELTTKIDNYFSSQCLFDGYGFLQKGVDNEYDDIVENIINSKKYLTEYKNYLIELTSINTLKIGYNNISGYYIEIQKKQSEKVNSEFILKQTLVNTQRYTTDKLIEYEKKINEAEHNIKIIENKYLNDIFEDILNKIKDIEKISNEIAFIDMICSFTEASIKNRYVRSNINDKSLINIERGKHPIIEQKLKYIPNDLEMNEKDIWIITGPNMGGKSSFLRQNALIIILNQIGCFVPAIKSDLMIVDKIFSRIGASDNIYRQQSTFMVEMIETAYIMKNATQNSFIILDELGRGTSTYDGIAIAWAVIDYILNKIGAKTLFATHYFEISDIVNKYTYIKNKSMGILESEDGIVFLYSIEDGVQNKSYGIDVAKLSGMPDKIIEQAKQIQEKLESK